MSAEEDTELRDLLLQTLENNGSLAKIRAQLRACVFMAFDEDEKNQLKQPLKNNKINKHLETPEGQLLFALVHELLEYYNMKYTLSVYKSESYAETGYSCKGRDKLLNELNLNENDSPILLQLLKNMNITNVPVPVSTTNNSHSNGLNVLNINGSIDLEPETIKVPLLNQTFDIPNSTINVNNESKNNTPRSISSDGKDDTYEGTSSIAEDSLLVKENTISIETENNADVEAEHITNGSISPNKVELTEDKVEKQESQSDKTEKLSAKSEKFKSKSPRSAMTETSATKRSNDFVLPSLYKSQQEFEDNLDNYEEDFMSTSEVDLKSDTGLLEKLESLKLKSESMEKSAKEIKTDDAVSNASSVTSEDFDLNSTVDEILKSNSN